MFAISPIDGRYLNKTYFLREYFSEFAYYRKRLEIEIDYYLSLNILLNNEYMILKINFGENEFKEIKEIEKDTNHDVKAIEYFLQKRILKNQNLIHFGLTSNDINSLAFTLNFKDSLLEINKIFKKMENELNLLIEKSKDIKLLARTHGQPAVPTYLCKELLVYKERLLKLDINIELTTKFGGAIGNFNSLYYVLPNIDWINFANKYVEKYNIKRQQFTTQIEHYDEICVILNNIKQKSVVIKCLIDNLWLWISNGYFVQMLIKEEIGSSTMPQKVNPIHFENAMGNFELLIGNIEAITRSLPLSRYQRDLKDSTILRNIGVVLGYYVIMIDNVREGISRLSPNKEIIENELNNHPEVIMEGIQTYLRYIGFNNPYELTKNFSRGEKKSLTDIYTFIDNLDISENDKNKLKELSPMNYLGKYPQ